MDGAFNIFIRIRIMNGKGLFFIISLLFFGQISRSQKPFPHEQLLRHLLLLQSKEAGEFEEGGFASYREYQLNIGRFKNDNNSFYTGLILMTLRDLYPEFSDAGKKLADSIIRLAIPSFQRFKNQKGRPTFNFWSTNPPRIFPNGGWLNWFDKPRALPDDMDCTSISTLALARPDSVAQTVHGLMQAFVNDGVKKLMPTFDEVEDLPVYSTWFGVKMPVEFDAPVICNVLTMVYHYSLPLTRADSASIEYLTTIIRKRYHLSDPMKVSPNYASPSIILYHYSRLMNKGKIESLEELKPVLIHDADSLYKISENLVEKSMLSTALMRWGVEPPKDTVEIKSGLINAVHEQPFVFFIANLGIAFPDGWKHRIASGKAGRFHYYCPAWDITLLLENIITAGSFMRRDKVSHF